MSIRPLRDGRFVVGAADAVLLLDPTGKARWTWPLAAADKRVAFTALVDRVIAKAGTGGTRSLASFLGGDAIVGSECGGTDRYPQGREPGGMEGVPGGGQGAPDADPGATGRAQVAVLR